MKFLKADVLSFTLMICGLAALAPAQAQTDDADLLLRLQDGNHIGLMRNSTAPGSDDPPNFRIGDCSTQRNLSQGGRDQAVVIGQKLREAGIDDARVVSSQWCRCLDTANLLEIGEVEELPYLNSLVSYPGQGGQMTRDLAAWVAEAELSRTTILVTHQINISSIVRSGAGEGDIVVVRRETDGGLSLVGRLTLYR